MTPAAILAAVKDAVILIAICAVGYILITYGKDVVKVNDVKALTTQLTKNAEQVATWQKESTDADTKRQASLAAVASAIANQRAPVFVMRGPTSGGAVPGNTAQASGTSAGTGGTDAGRGATAQPVNIRPGVNAFELKYETAIADCQAAIDKWPVVPP